MRLSLGFQAPTGPCMLVVSIALVAGCFEPDYYGGAGLGLVIENESDRTILIDYLGWRDLSGGGTQEVAPGSKTGAGWQCRPDWNDADWMHVRALFTDGSVADEKNWTVPECPESYTVTIHADYKMTLVDDHPKSRVGPEF